MTENNAVVCCDVNHHDCITTSPARSGMLRITIDRAGVDCGSVVLRKEKAKDFANTILSMCGADPEPEVQPGVDRMSHKCMESTRDAARAIANAFPWEQSAEGHEYWRKINERLLNLAVKLLETREQKASKQAELDRLRARVAELEKELA